MDDKMVYFQTYTDVLHLLGQTRAQLQTLSEENHALSLEKLELKVRVDQEVERRNQVERIVNSPGSATDQLVMWSEKVKILQQITDLQSTLIDKEFILKKNDIITDLRATFDADTSQQSNVTPLPEYSLVSSDSLDNILTLYHFHIKLAHVYIKMAICTIAHQTEHL